MSPQRVQIKSRMDLDLDLDLDFLSVFYVTQFQLTKRSVFHRKGRLTKGAQCYMGCQRTNTDYPQGDYRSGEWGKAMG